jgi:hypothetical protein
MKILENFDFVGYEPKITVYGSDRYKTFFGSMMGFLCTLAVLGLSIYFTKIMFDRTDMSVLQNVWKNKEKPVNLTNSFFYFSLIDGKNQPINPKFYDIRFDFWEMVNIKSGDPLTAKITSLPMEECNGEKHFGEYKDSVFFHLKESKCLAANKFNISLYGLYGDIFPYSFLNVAVNFCNNATTNNTCPSESELAPALRNVFLFFGYIDNQIDHNDLNQPVKPYVKSQVPPLNWDLHNRYFENIGVVDYFTDTDLIFENYLLTSSYMSTKLDLTVSIRHGSALYPGITFGTLTFIRDHKVTTFKKSFLKVQTLLAKIGGILNALSFIFKLVSSIITKNLLLEKIFNEFFYIENKLHDKSLVKDISLKSKQNLIVNNINLHKM